MKQSIYCGILLLIGAKYLGLTAIASDSPGELSPLIVHVLSDGKNKTIPSGFAHVLRLSTNNPVGGEYIFSKSSTGTNCFWVSLQDTNVALVTTTKGSLTWWYVTDATGQLHRAIVSDSSIREGGLTNLPVAEERETFDAQKREWLSKYSR